MRINHSCDVLKWYTYVNFVLHSWTCTIPTWIGVVNIATYFFHPTFGEFGNTVLSKYASLFFIQLIPALIVRLYEDVLGAVFELTGTRFTQKKISMETNLLEKYR